MKSKQRRGWIIRCAARFVAVTVKPGDWCYADRDGVLFSDVQLVDSTLTAVPTWLCRWVMQHADYGGTRLG